MTEGKRTKHAQNYGTYTEQKNCLIALNTPQIAPSGLLTDQNYLRQKDRNSKQVPKMP